MQNSYEDVKVNAEDLEAKLVASDLTYTAKNTANVVVERTQKIQYSQAREYKNGEEVIIDLQTGNDYISSKDSYLKFTLKLFQSDGTTAATGVNGFVVSGTSTAGSVLNLFRTIRVVSRSGGVLSQIDKANLLAYQKLRYTNAHQWQQQQGVALLGFNKDTITNAGEEFIVPMNMLAPIFDVHELLPNMLCRGLRLEILLEAPAVALVRNAAGNVGAYTIENVELHADSYRLSDGALNLLNQQSASSGLVLQYCDYENSNFDKPLNVQNVSYDVRKTASMAMSAIAVVRPNTQLASATADSFKSSTIDNATWQYQWRVGSTYLPLHPIKGSLQSYAQAVYAYGRMRNGRELGVNLTDFPNVNHAVVDISRYWLDNSGLALNNSTSLTFIGVVKSEASSVDIYLKHNRVITIFLENVVKSS